MHSCCAIPKDRLASLSDCDWLRKPCSGATGSRSAGTRIAISPRNAFMRSSSTTHSSLIAHYEQPEWLVQQPRCPWGARALGDLVVTHLVARVALKARAAIESWRACGGAARITCAHRECHCRTDVEVLPCKRRKWLIS